MAMPAMAPVPKWLPAEELLVDEEPEVELAELDAAVSEGKASPGVIW